MKVSTVVLMVVTIPLLLAFYVWYFQNYNLRFVYLPVAVPLALVAVVGIVYSLVKKNYDLLAYSIIIFLSSILAGHLYRGIFLPTINVD